MSILPRETTPSKTKPSPAHGTTTRYRLGCRCEQCRSADAAYSRRWRAEHPEKVAARQRRYQAAHPEKLANYQRAYYLSHHEEKLAHDRTYRRVHAEEKRVSTRNRRARLRGNGGIHTAADVRAQYERQRGKCYWCGAKVPWRKKHVDHAIPTTLGGSNGPENIVITCAACNLSKGSKLPHEFSDRLC